MADKGKGKSVEVKKAAPSGEVTRAEPARYPLADLRREVDRLFEDFEVGFPFGFGRRLFEMEPFRRLESRLPAVDMSESTDAYTLSAEMPGLEDKDVEVSLSEDTLTVKGEKSEERKEEEKDYYLSERRYGAFQRSFRLPESVDRDKIKAELKNGVLTVTLPKTAEAKKKTKKIEVKKG